MNKTFLGILVVVVLIGVGVWVYLQGKPAATSPTPTSTATTATTTADLGTYPYECDEHVTFSMTPASDMSSIHIAPANGGAYPPESTLVKKALGNAAVRYEGNGIVFTAKGETVTLGEGDSAINCSPVANPDAAPFNFGD